MIRFRKNLIGCCVLFTLQAVSSEALVAWQDGATYSESVNDLGVTGVSVSVGIVEADIDGGTAIVYRINPDHSIGSFMGIFSGKTITYYDPGTPTYTGFSWHANGSGVYSVGNYSNNWGPTSARGIALGVTNIGNYEADYFITNFLDQNLVITEKVFSFAFTTQTNSQEELIADMDRMVDTQGKVFVQGVRPRPAADSFGGDNPAGMGVAYNIITVGKCRTNYNAATNSQFGPAWAIGTAKPDLLSGHISESSATARGAGGAALVIDHALKGGWTNACDPRVVKAIMMAGATKTLDWDKGSAGPSDDHHVPTDYRSGAGIMNCLDNFGIIYGGEVAPSSLNERAAWDLGAVSPTARTNVYYLEVLQTNIYLSVTLAWNRHVSDSATNLQNLDLRLYDATNMVLQSELDWSTSTIDSVEHLWFLVETTGQLGIVVDGAMTSTSEVYGIAWKFDGHTNSALLDADADGVYDSYEQEHFEEIYFYEGSDDPDVDGVDNYSEFLADTEPNNGTNFFEVTVQYIASNDEVVVSFDSSTGRVYRAEYSDVFTMGTSEFSQATVTSFWGNGGTTNWTDDGSETPTAPSLTTSRVYRINVSLP